MASEREPKAVLCVDDSDAVLECLEALLALNGYSVLTAIDGTHALELIARHSVDAVILDCHMPGMSGSEVALRMRAIGVRVPIVMFFGDDRAPQGMDKIIDAFISKGQPSCFDSLARKVGDLVSDQPVLSLALTLDGSKPGNFTVERWHHPKASCGPSPRALR